MNLKELIELALKGNADAQYKLGKLYRSGDYVIQNNNTAIELFRKAAKQGHKSAEYELDSLIKYIHKIPSDTNKTEAPTTSQQIETDDEAYKQEVESWFADVSISLGSNQKESLAKSGDENTKAVIADNLNVGSYYFPEASKKTYKRGDPFILAEIELTKINKNENFDHSEAATINNEQLYRTNTQYTPFIGGLILFSGIGIFGYQVYEFLRLDIWHSISVITALQYINVQWANYPIDWLGLYRILDFIPLSIFACVLGVVITIIELVISDATS